MKRINVFFFALSLCLCSLHVSANPVRFIGFSQEETEKLQIDFNWFLQNAPEENVFFKLLRYEMEKTSGVSMSEIPRFLYNHFPLVISSDQAIRMCPNPPSQCSPDNFQNWQQISRSDQVMVQKLLRLYTPYMDRRFESSIIGFSKDRLLSISDRNQTMAVVNKQMLSQSSEVSDDYLKWVSMSQWLGLARLHQVFASNGSALTECKTMDGGVYLCDPYSNGSMYIASLALIAGSEECGECTNNERLMLKILAFDHIIRTGKDEGSEKVVQFLRKSLDAILDKDSPDFRMLMEMYRVRNESAVRGLTL